MFIYLIVVSFPVCVTSSDEYLAKMSTFSTFLLYFSPSQIFKYSPTIIYEEMKNASPYFSKFPLLSFVVSSRYFPLHLFLYIVWICPSFRTTTKDCTHIKKLVLNRLYFFTFNQIDFKTWVGSVSRTVCERTEMLRDILWEKMKKETTWKKQS